jgi:predicted amidohydrolase YtcJ
MSETADLVVVGARVHTGAAPAPGASAVAVRGGRILAVGSASEVRALSGPRTEVLEHPGATILAGMNDAHAHIAQWGASRPPLALDVSPRVVSSIADVAGLVRRAASEQPPGTWIRGYGWDVGFLAECTADPRRRLTRADLDAAAPDHPVILFDFSLHAIWVNSRAIEIGGVTAATPTPTGGDITRDERGEPEGIFSEFAAQNLIQQHVPALTREERRTAIAAATAELHELGTTSVTDPALGPGGGDSMLGTETLRAYEDMAREGQLGLRVSALLLFGAEGTVTVDDMREGLEGFAVDARDAPPTRLRVGGIKIFGDGIPPLHTAWLHEPYADAPSKGSLVIPGADDEARVRELHELVRLAHAAGHQIGIHATGDAAIDATVDAFAAAVARHPREDTRHYVIHADLTYARSLRTMGEHRFGASSQPSIKTAAAHLSALLLGEERAAYQWPYRSMIDAGVPLVFSSDAPVVWPDWRQGVAAAATRVSAANGVVYGPEERISVEEAIAAYTSGGAWQDFAEAEKGTVEPGKVADLCVLGGDPFTGDPAEIPEMPVVATVLDGVPVHVA